MDSYLLYQLFTLLIPILLPLLVGAVAFRLGLDARASRARIKHLEKDPSSSGSLIHILHSIEKEVDDVVADMLDDPQLTSETQSSSSESESDVQGRAPRTAATSTPPILTDAQQRIIATINSLPQLQKHFAFIHPVMNSHAVIVSRDVKRFEGHRKGEGVLRHWADRFQL